MDKNAALKKYFGYECFRSGQEPLIDAILAGRDALEVMPTGGGKSICYQLPALLLPSVTLVISPLISLMKDQVAALKSAGIDAAFINSTLSSSQLSTVYTRLRQGLYKIVYIAPERLDGDGFTTIARGLDISLVAVDEAHCVSQWGQDFRPSYLRIAEFIGKLPHRPVLAAFTATATERVRRDIQELLEMNTPQCVVTGFDRPNLYFDILHPKNKPAVLRQLVEERRDKTGIIYCSTRAAVEKVCDDLIEQGIAATRYHAGLSGEERRRNQEHFQNDRKTVMVATNAFGMGIDKSNVGYIIHHNMPMSLEAYYQEAGRAGRDGEAAECILLHSAGDIRTAKFLIQNGAENDQLDEREREAVTARDLQRLDEMIAYCRSSDCLRGYILDYFGQSHDSGCGNCGNCRSTYTVEDITVHAQMIMSCVKRVKDFLGYHVGASLIVRILHGGADKRVMQLRLNSLSVYGLMKDVPRRRISDEIDYLASKDYLRVNPEHSTLELTRSSAEVLFRGETVTMQVKTASASKDAELTGGRELFEALRALRAKIASEENVPAYVVFSNATLTDMAAKCPGSMMELLQVNGVGEVKAAKYGKEFLEAIERFGKGDLE